MQIFQYWGTRTWSSRWDLTEGADLCWPPLHLTLPGSLQQSPILWKVEQKRSKCALDSISSMHDGPAGSSSITCFIVAAPTAEGCPVPCPPDHSKRPSLIAGST